VTLVRRILKWTTYLVTRRCSERRFFQKPSARTETIFSYALAVAAARYGILVHAYCVVSKGDPIPRA
jgi:tRNA/tmRNA/rRNA uracil-C5-methylase (TrmA/RlmC/RlmD family)